MSVLRLIPMIILCVERASVTRVMTFDLKIPSMKNGVQVCRTNPTNMDFESYKINHVLKCMSVAYLLQFQFFV